MRVPFLSKTKTGSKLGPYSPTKSFHLPYGIRNLLLENAEKKLPVTSKFTTSSVLVYHSSPIFTSVELSEISIVFSGFKIPQFAESSARSNNGFFASNLISCISLFLFVRADGRYRCVKERQEEGL
jgi:hypothetical protein